MAYFTFVMNFKYSDKFHICDEFPILWQISHLWWISHTVTNFTYHGKFHILWQISHTMASLTFLMNFPYRGKFHICDEFHILWQISHGIANFMMMNITEWWFVYRVVDFTFYGQFLTLPGVIWQPAIKVNVPLTRMSMSPSEYGLPKSFTELYPGLSVHIHLLIR